jgi:predicted alpha/beta-fold hydrolase
MSRDYSAPRWLAGAHAQTIYPALFGPPKIALRRERVDTPDGDFVDFDWQDTSGAAPGTPTVVLFH